MTKFKNSINENDVEIFKESYCNENSIIIQLLKENTFYRHFAEPILDVGSGMGDILSLVVPEKEVIHIDVNDFSKFKLPIKHKRITSDFYNFDPKWFDQINTVFIAHTLQFIDDDIEMLNNKILDINPQNIITVTNENNDFMATLINWSFRMFPKPNPEVILTDFPLNYDIHTKLPFTATLKCPDFEILANQVCYLMLIEPNSEQKKMLVNLLKQNLQTPTFTINQTIKIYKKNG
ncbi:hypothetical protein [Flavobacterium sp. UBA6031]|uniref:hypothetical protein n=1 Tax=Flavobacterium sp. UBA6031 TaxID=1946551 RepID=UPI0025C25A43|nr:hypothetical protein [Flavobacterium sp. UBA6031]